jgi:molybdopterin synthase catalytic subunit
MPVRVQTEDFDVSAELKALRAGRPQVGAVAMFVGTVRDINEGDAVSAMELEHYPGMTESSLQAMIDQAQQRWDVLDCLIVHRVGRLAPLDQIVLVIVSSAHRKQAFEACEYLMDFLKTEAPFWKKESTLEGTRWVEARETDGAAAARWAQPPAP